MGHGFLLLMQEKDLLNLYAEVSAENDQLLSQLEIAKDIKIKVWYFWNPF